MFLVRHFCVYFFLPTVKWNIRRIRRDPAWRSALPRDRNANVEALLFPSKYLPYNLAGTDLGLGKPPKAFLPRVGPGKGSWRSASWAWGGRQKCLESLEGAIGPDWSWGGEVQGSCSPDVKSSVLSVLEGVAAILIDFFFNVCEKRVWQG